MTGELDCRLLDWDSEFFRCRIARVEVAKPGASGMEAVLEHARAERIDCLYLLLDGSDVDTARAAEATGFRCVDVRLTLERTLVGIATEMPAEVEAFRSADLPRLRSIARTSHGASRFYHDPHFPSERCDALYDAWITRSCTETPENVLVVRRDDVAVSYLTCDLDSSRVGSIGLVAVAEAERGKHLGNALLEASLVWFARQGCKRVQVVTQERNRAASRLYEGYGFRSIRRENWYHLWPDREWPAEGASEPESADRGTPRSTEGR